MSEQLLNRKEFIIAGAAWGVSALAVFNRFYSPRLEELKRPEVHLESSIDGLWINSPYLWTRSPEYILDILALAEVLGVSTIRIFAPPVHNIWTGERYYENTARMHTFLAMVEAYREFRQHPIGVDLVFLDGYELFHKNKPNLWYPNGPLTSMFIDPEEPAIESQKRFFTDETVRDAFFGLMRAAVQEYQDYGPVIGAWEIGNEFEVPRVFSPSERVSLMTDLQLRAVEVVRTLDQERAIILGTIFPWQVDERKLSHISGLRNSYHAYPRLNERLDRLQKHCENCLLPLVVSEFGLSEKVPFTDMFLAGYIRKILNATGRVGNPMSVLGLWKLDQYFDSFVTNIEQYPQTVAVMRQFGKHVRPDLYQNRRTHRTVRNQ